ncbi:MAG: tetratricopeptide repeat protein [Oligoflexus sp.]
MKRIANFIFSVAVSFSVAASAQSDPCFRQEIAKHIAAIQSLAPDLRGISVDLKNCRDDEIKEQILFWEAFYSHQTGAEADQFRQAAQLFPQATDQLEKNRTIRSARLGEYKALKKQIDDGKLDYTEDRRNLITLARSMARQKLFKEALSYYDEFLKQQPDHEIADAEYLFVMIWSGDIATSRVRINRLKSYELTPYLSSAVKKAENILDQVKKQPESESSQRVFLKGTFAASAEQFTQEDDSSRRTLKFSYDHHFYGSVGIHEIKSNMEASPDRASEFSFGGRLALGKVLQLQSEIGFFSLGDDNATGLLASKIQLGFLQLAAGAKRQALTLLRVVPEDGQGVMKNEAFGSIAIGSYIDFFASLAQDGHFSPYEFYQLQLKLPAFKKLDDLESLVLKLPIRYEGHPKPSPFYPTVPKSLSAGFGVEYHRYITDLYSFRGEAEYLIANRNSRFNRDSFQRVSSYQIKADLLYDLRRATQVSLGLDFFERSRDQFEKADERYLTITAGLQYTAKP